ncbi:MAG TPA: GAF domain-containing sensor histidine kinase [Solirubrobacterales bacterium]|nr:GAF domain-containing sensor histidine kinase [Solirubrobacterales bacterium]
MTNEVLDAERLRLLIEVGRGLVSKLELETVLNRVIEVGRELTGARYAALGILDEDRQELERFLTLGIDEEARQAIGDLPRGHGVLGEVIRDPRPLRLDNVGDHPRSYGFPAAHPLMRTFLGVPVMIRGEAFGNLYLTEKESGPFDEADEEAAVILADFAAIAIDNARLYTRAEARRQDLERTVRRLEATTDLARALEANMDLHHMLELIAKRGRTLVDARWLAILLADEAAFEVAAVAGEISSNRVGTRLERPGTLVEQVLREGRTRRAADLTGTLTETLGDVPAGDDAALFIPLSVRATRMGVLVAAEESVDGRPVGADDVRLLEALAATAATAVHTARSVASDRLRHSIETSERERQRWARELHDETLQGLGGLRVLLSSGLRGSGEDLSDAARRAVAQIGEEIRNLRALITELRPAALDELGLVPAIETLAQRTATTEGLTLETNIDLRLEGETRLEPEVESAVYRLAQEALTNVVKHARANRVEMNLTREDSAVVLTVSDDGIGFDPDGSGPGFGLIGMRERVSLTGGRLEIESQDGAGTTLRATLPVRFRNGASA